jgi:hypothetical protein
MRFAPERGLKGDHLLDGAPSGSPVPTGMIDRLHGPPASNATAGASRRTGTTGRTSLPTRSAHRTVGMMRHAAWAFIRRGRYIGSPFSPLDQEEFHDSPT